METHRREITLNDHYGILNRLCLKEGFVHEHTGRQTVYLGGGTLSPHGLSNLSTATTFFYAIALEDHENPLACDEVGALEIHTPPDLAGVAHDVDFPLHARDPIGDLSHDRVHPTACRP
jgi:hypothetical protein